MRTRAVAIVAVLAATFVPIAAAAPLGQITESASAVPNGDQGYGIAAGADGNIWVGLQGTTAAIERLAPDGTTHLFTQGLQASNGSSIQILSPGPDGNVWFTDPGVESMIGKITLSGAITEYALPAGAVAFGIAAGPDGNMWFTDTGNNKIGRITPSGTVTEYGTASGLSVGSRPGQITAGPDGNMWFTDDSPTTPAIGTITTAGTPGITEYAIGTLGTNPGSITAGPDGDIWFGDDGSTKGIWRVTPTGKMTEFTSGLISNTYPTLMAPGPDGNVWFADAGHIYPNGSGVGRITPDGTITEFTAGLQDNGLHSFVQGLAAGPDGSMWFTDQGAANEVGEAGTGVQAASVRAPSVTGSGQAGTQQVCQGDQWAPWAGLPEDNAYPWDGFKWLRDGTAIAGQTGAAYTPAASDVGHQLSCTITVSYPKLLELTESATSAGITVIPQASGPQGTPGAQGGTGPQGPRGPAGKVELVKCKTVKRKHKQKLSCTTTLVSAPVKFKVAARSARAKLMRRGLVVATGDATVSGSRVRSTRLLCARTLHAGRYTLVVSVRQRVLVRQTVAVS